MDFVSKVCQFNEIAGNKNQFSERQVALYIGLCLEEMAEVIDECGSRAAFEHMVKTLNHWSIRFKEGDFDQNLANIDKEKALDGFIDLAVVSVGGAYSLGADVNGACNEVADSNLSKFLTTDGGYAVIKDGNGKVKKGPLYKKPSLGQYLP